MNKKILALLLSITLAFCTLSFAACKRPKFKIVEPEGGYTVIPGGSVTIGYENANEGIVSFEIVDGADYAEEITNGGVLTVINGGKELVGETVKVAATHTNGEEVITSETVVTIVDIKLTAIKNLSIPWAYVYPGVTVDLEYTKIPANTTQDDVQIEIIGPATYADGKITVSSTAGEGEIKVRAFRGDVSSDVLTVQVKLPSNDPYNISGPDNGKVESGATSQASFDIRVNHDDDGSAVNGIMIEFSVTRGAQLLSINSKGYTCYLKVLGHGEAEVTARLLNGRTHTVTVNCIKTPSRLDLPGYLTGKANIDYTVGKDQFFDFAAVVPQTGTDALSCTAVKYSFTKIAGDTETEPFAVYENGKITFNATGKFKVTATSDSKNSNGEISTSSIINVNDGINVSTWEQLKEKLEDTANDGKDINIVATKSLTGNGYNYGYSLVPRLIIDDNVNDAATIEAGVTVVCPFSVSLNGNGHTIDISRLKYVEAWNSYRLGAVLHFRSGNDGADPGYDVKIKDLVMRGNAGVDGVNKATGREYLQNMEKDGNNNTITNGEIVGVHECAIEIGFEYADAYYTPNIENVKIYGFSIGVRINRALPGSKCSSLEFDDCFKNGMRIAASVIELKDIIFGNYGAFGIEASNAFSMNAKDENGNETNQKITLTGDIKVSNKNQGNTKFFNGFKFLGNTMGQIIWGILASFKEVYGSDLTETQLGHIKNQNNEISFFIFVFLDPTVADSTNVSEVIIDDIVNILDITTKRTAERFIEVPIDISQPGFDFDLGKMIFFNLNFQP